ncbi:MAG: EF-P beta-lysylation protein EpmB [Planctomycetes bacterium]|nr:EF-P beta-lysylation protein EpmB [Planctomycetota bacterium]
MTILSATMPVVRPRIAVPRYDTWQEALRDAVRDVDELCRLLDMPAEAARAARQAAGQFPLFVPRGFVARMRPGDSGDPLLRQVLPLADEMREVPGFVADPVGDAAATRQPGLLQKYHGRVLFITTGTCAVHCRYCFRRSFPYDEAPRSLDDWRPAIDQIAADDTIREVILSGGDPLTLVDASLAALVEQLADIAHLRRLRIHTRLPIVIPERVTDSLIDVLRDMGLATIVVIHANHANELDEHVAAALAKMADAGIVLLNQAVLLAGVNDSVEAQAALCERLVDLRVMPYYLHQLDRVAGAAHFEVPIRVGQEIIEELKSRLPGYAVPRYVQEVAGAESKIELK